MEREKFEEWARDNPSDFKYNAAIAAWSAWQARAALDKDGERYRWLRTQPQWLGWESDFRPDEIDREIDAAMAKEPK